ncbi:MAG TPA: hypothetical protein PK629_03540 [Oscillospiraceae bacterium]|nr:hypothetical protein [Oscillospiraceae bacterium]HPF56934.1 hypothetical protein [Clostridiales bacterium]HPK35656.1 hypothetical protein [Oscillospiraceae bacterium]HPR75806.1 hypothetical protein [Oscillospiraceae bacterium]
MWALYVFGGLAVLITALLLSDVCIDITYDHAFLIKAGLWRANIVLFPEDRKKPKKEKEKEEPKEEKTEEKEESKPDLQELAGQIKSILGLLGRALKKARLKPCKIHIVAAAGDAAKTAILYGTFCAGLTAVQTVLNELFGRYESDFLVLWDYEGKNTSVEADLKIRIRIFWILTILWPVILRYIANPDLGLEAALTGKKSPKKQKTPQKRNKKS